ncbi:MAG: hypothetical protein HC836_44280 [Richelia sp. RM2_1_2]|nr:hypothetical protein [Richelia sp. RM2_1_2]
MLLEFELWTNTEVKIAIAIIKYLSLNLAVLDYTTVVLNSRISNLA